MRPDEDKKGNACVKARENLRLKGKGYTTVSIANMAQELNHIQGAGTCVKHPPAKSKVECGAGTSTETKKNRVLRLFSHISSL
jgi:hypothetical protein